MPSYIFMEGFYFTLNQLFNSLNFTQQSKVLMNYNYLRSSKHNFYESVLYILLISIDELLKKDAINMHLNF